MVVLSVVGAISYSLITCVQIPVYGKYTFYFLNIDTQFWHKGVNDNKIILK